MYTIPPDKEKKLGSSFQKTKMTLSFSCKDRVICLHLEEKVNPHQFLKEVLLVIKGRWEIV